MSLNIKNEETCRLAGELARLTGETMTGAITVALRQRLERERRERSAWSGSGAPSCCATGRPPSSTAISCMTSAGSRSDHRH